MNEAKNNQRSLNDLIAKKYLKEIREKQRRSEDLWHEIGIIKLKLDDYLFNRKPLSELEYSQKSTNADYLTLINDDALVRELKARIEQKRFALLIQKSLVGIKLIGEKGERIEMTHESK